MVDHLLSAAGEGVLLAEIPELFGLDIVAQDLDLAGIPDAEP